MRYPLFGIGQTGKSPKVTSERRINVYVEQTSDRGPLSFHQRPGLKRWTYLGATPIRGWHAFGDDLLVAHRTKLYSINNAKEVTELGTLSTSGGRVNFADNGTQVMCVDGSYGYIVESGALSQIADPDFVSADTVIFQGGRFVVNRSGTGQFHLSASYDGQTYDGTEFATAETFPDDLVAVWEDQGEVMLFGTKSMEAWSNIGALDFPYQRIDGAVVEWGLAARNSLAKVGNTTCWLGQNRNGETQVVQLNGYRPQVISSPEMESTIQNYGNVTVASALSYHAKGHTFYQLNFPEGSWCYDVTSRQWSEWQAGTIGDRHLAELAVHYIGKTLVSDYRTGTIYELDPETLDDDGDEFAKEIQSRHLFDERNVFVNRLWADMQTGVGLATGQGSDPQIMLQVSKDGGKTWGPEKWTSLGKIGEFKTRALWRRLGRGHDWTFRLRVSDPVQFALAGAWVNTQ